MGICCTGKQTKSEYKTDDIIKPHSIPKEIKSSRMSNAGINYEIQQNVFNIQISQLISSTNAFMSSPQIIENNEYHQLGNAFPINKTNIECLWNVFIEYKEDFTTCNIVNLDLRKAKPENFLKKMKKINYSFDEMMLMRHDRIENFKRYLSNKEVIVILENDKLDDLSKIIQFFIEQQFNISSLKILNSNLNTEVMSLTEKTILNTLDLQKIDYYPYMLLSLRYLSHFQSENYIFFHKVNVANIKNTSKYKFIPEYISNYKLSKDDPYLSFWIDFKVNCILRVSNCAFSESKIDFKHCKTDNAVKNAANSILLCISFTSIQDRPKALNGIFDIVKREINMKQSIIIQMDESFAEDIMFEFMILLIMSITSLPIKMIIGYLRSNVPFIHNVEALYLEKEKEINEILKIYELNE